MFMVKKCPTKFTKFGLFVLEINIDFLYNRVMLII